MQVSISMFANLAEITYHRRCCLHNHAYPRWGWRIADQVSQGLGCFLQSGEMYKLGPAEMKANSIAFLSTKI